MHPRKGIDDLLRAFAQLRLTNPEAHLYLAGEGPMLEAYKELAAQLGLGSSAIFLGFCDDPRQYLFAADIFVLASHADPGPLVIAEARSAGLAIIATNVNGIPAMLDYGEAGILVPPHQPEALAAALRRLLNDPPCSGVTPPVRSRVRNASRLSASAEIWRRSTQKCCKPKKTLSAAPECPHSHTSWYHLHF